MTKGRARSAARLDWATRLAVWRAGLGAPPAQFTVPPEPRSIGSAAIGRQICDGQVVLAGRRVTLSGDTIWSVALPGSRSEADRHGFTWLEDLAAAGTREAAQIGQDWLIDWIGAYDTGHGPGWAPDVAARRLVRWIHHATALMDGMDQNTEARFRRSLSRHVLYLMRHWRRASPGMPTFEALCGLIIGGLALKGMEPKVRPAIVCLERLCKDEIDRDGGLPSRNPEDLLDLFSLLIWVDAGLAEVGLVSHPQHRAAIERIAPTLRALRHADGTLPRFHDGGRGIEGRLDSALAASRVRSKARTGLAMGYARLARGRSTVIVDAAAPPRAPHADTAHASTLAFEMTVGRRPLVTNCGSGTAFGADWHKAARATPAHSTLAPEGASSGRLVPARRERRTHLILTKTARSVQCHSAPDRGAASLDGTHDAFAGSYGLTHTRRLDLGGEGLSLAGEDILSAVTETDRRQFQMAQRQHGPGGLRFSLRFHLHPDVTATMDANGLEVNLMLKSGELWRFRHVSSARISLDPSVYLEKTQPQPIPTRQIVLEALAVEFTTVVRWSFYRPKPDQPVQRDLYRDDMSIT